MGKKEEKVQNKFEGKAQKIKEKYLFAKINEGSMDELISSIKHYIKEIKDKDAQIATLERELASKQKYIERLKEKLDAIHNDPDNLDLFKGYKERWTYVEKICFVLERSKKPLSAGDIVELILKLEPVLAKRLANPYNSITRSIYIAEKLGRIERGDTLGNYGSIYSLRI